MRRSLFPLVLILVGSPLFAQDIRERWGVGGAVGYGDYLSPGSAKKGTNADLYLSGWVREGVGSNTELIAALDGLSATGSSVRSGLRARALTLGLLQPLIRPDDWVPYVVLAGGAAFVHAPGAVRPDVVQPVGKFGLGLERYVGAKSTLGLQINYHYLLSNGRYAPESSAASVALTYTSFFYCGLGAQRVLPSPAAVPPPNATPVYSHPTAVIAQDTDGDGVPDLRDNCPDTPEGQTVDAFGCPKDSDGDGVLDDLDACPNTPAGALVNSAGCPAETVSVTLDIKFDAGQSVVKPEFDAQIGKVADFMARFPNTTVLIEGHTDNAGNPATSLPLSQRRADAVRQTLVAKFHVAPGRVTAKGYGDTRPIANNKTPEGRAANRRVVATLSATKK